MRGFSETDVKPAQKVQSSAVLKKISTHIPIRKLAEAIAKYEGHGIAGAIPTTHNNPGSLRARKGGFQKFKTVEEGYKALEKTIRHYSPYSLTKMMHYYAPKSDNNNTEAYIRFIVRSTGIDPNTPLKDILIDI